MSDENDECNHSNDGKPEAEICSINRGKKVFVSVSGSNGESVEDIQETAKDLFDEAISRNHEIGEEPPTKGTQ